MKKAMYLIVVAAGLLAIISFTEKSSIASRNKIRTHHFYEEVFNKHSTAMLDSFVDPDYVEHQTDVHYSANRKGLKKEFEDYFQAFPDVHLTINFMLAEGDLVTSQYTMTGTHEGKIYGKDASNKKVNINGVDVVRYKNGKAIEHWGYLEEGKLLTQLGLIREAMKGAKSE